MDSLIDQYPSVKEEVKNAHATTNLTYNEWIAQKMHTTEDDIKTWSRANVTTLVALEAILGNPEVALYSIFDTILLLGFNRGYAARMEEETNATDD